MSIEKLSPLAVPFVGGIPAPDKLVDFYGDPLIIDQYGIVSFFPLIDPSVNVLSVLWDFGDGYTSTDLSATHVYRLPGQFTVTFTVYTIEGGSIVEQKFFYIVVNAVNITIPDFPDRAANLLIEEVRKQYGLDRTTPATEDEIAQIVTPLPVVVELEPVTDFADRAVNLLNENVRKQYGQG
jgi:PKD repeat protein